MFDKEVLKSKVNQNLQFALQYLNSTMTSKELYDYLKNYIKNVEDEIVYLPIPPKFVIFMHIIELECNMPYTISANKEMVNEFILSDKNHSYLFKLYDFYDKIIKKYNKKNKFFTYIGIIHDHNGYLVYPTDDYIFMATIDNSIKFNYNIGYIENSNNSYPIKIFSKEV